MESPEKQPVLSKVEAQREYNRRSYLKHKERRLKERKALYEDTEERIRKNTLCRTYYWDKREEVLAHKKKVWEDRSEEEKEQQRVYQREWYKKNKEEHTLRGKLSRATKAATRPEKPKLRPKVRLPGEPKIKKSKAPKQYIQYDSTDRLPTHNTFSGPKSYYQKKLLNQRCPLGFFQVPQAPLDPFRVVF